MAELADHDVNVLARKIEDIGQKLDGLSAIFEVGFARVDTHFVQIDARFDQIDDRLAHVDTRFDSHFAEVAGAVGHPVLPLAPQRS